MFHTGYRFKSETQTSKQFRAALKAYRGGLSDREEERTYKPKGNSIVRSTERGIEALKSFKAINDRMETKKALYGKYDEVSGWRLYK